MIRIHVIEDNELIIVTGLRSLFRPNRDNIVFQGSSANVAEMISKVRAEDIDMIILDLYLPGTNPKENIRLLRQHFPTKPVMILTNEKSAVWMLTMRKEGAHSYLIKDVSRDELKLAIQKTAAGKVYFPELPDEAEIQATTNEARIFGELSPDHQTIIRLLVQGLYHEEIAQHINQSRSSVEKKLADARAAFNVRTNIELVHLLTRSGQV